MRMMCPTDRKFLAPSLKLFLNFTNTILALRSIVRVQVINLLSPRVVWSYILVYGYVNNIRSTPEYDTRTSTTYSSIKNLPGTRTAGSIQ